jgi:hypothetical protein
VATEMIRQRVTGIPVGLRMRHYRASVRNC